MRAFADLPPCEARMKDTLREQFERLALRLNELDATLADPTVASDMKRYRALSREHAEVSGLVERFRRFVQRERDLADAREMLSQSATAAEFAEMAEMARQEITEARASRATTCTRGSSSSRAATACSACR